MSCSGGMWRIGLVLAAAAACVAAAAGAVPPAAGPAATPTARPVSDAEHAKRAEEAKAAFDSLFSDSIRKVKATVSVKDDIELAGTFLAAARTSKNQPELAVLAAAAAAEYGSKGPEGFATALEAAQLVLEQPPEIRDGVLDNVAGYCQSIVSRSSGADREKAGEQLVAVLAVAGDDRAAAGDYAKAVIQYRKALDAGQAIKSAAMADIQAKLQMATLRQAALVRIDALAKQLQANPADTAARDEIIRQYLVEMDNPQRAAEYLDTKADDVRSKLILLAGMSTANLPEAACHQLAEMYAGLGDKAMPAVARTVMYARAKVYLRRVPGEAPRRRHPADRGGTGHQGPRRQDRQTDPQAADARGRRWSC